MYIISTEAKQDLPYVTFLFLFHVGGEGRTYDVAPSVTVNKLALAEARPQEIATSILNSPIKEQARHNVYNWTYPIHSLRSFFFAYVLFHYWATLRNFTSQGSEDDEADTEDDIEKAP